MKYNADVQKFAVEHGLLSYLELAYKKVKEFYTNPMGLRTEFVIDPESDEEWLSVRFTTEGSLETIRAAHDKYRNFWVRNVPVDKRLKITLMYDIE